MKKLMLFIVVGVLFTGLAQAETALEVCNAEAKDAGIEDQADFRAYVDECVEQVSAEMEAAKEEINEPEMTDVPEEAVPSAEES